MGYVTLTQESIPSYLEGISGMADILGTFEGLDIIEIGDGNLNYVYKISNPSDPEKSVILKQAVPYLRLAGEGWPLNRNRITFEIRALKSCNELVPDLVPTLYHSDEEMSVIIMQTLGKHRVVRYDMIEGNVLPKLGKDIGRYLADTLFHTSNFGMASAERRELMAQFTTNTDLCKLTEDFIFTFPLIEHSSNYDSPKTVEFANKTLRADSEYLLASLKLKEIFVSKSEALLHGDLHTGSLMANVDETFIIDPEFAFFGPIGFDVGKIIANFLLCHNAHYVRSEDDSYRNWLMGEIRAIWENFESGFLANWSKVESSTSTVFSEAEIPATVIEDYKVNFIRETVKEAVGFCACSITRRTLGIAGVADVRGIEDLDKKSEIEILNLKLAMKLMKSHNAIESFDAFFDLLKNFYAEETTNLV